MSVILIEERITHYETFGRGRPLIFLHGWLGSWRYWMPCMEALSDKYRSHAFDLWGYGDSSKQDGEHDIDSYLRLLEAFMDQMGILTAPLIGHSLGGVLAVLFAAAQPKRVSRLALVCTPLTESGINRSAVLGSSFWGRVQQKRQIAHAAVIQDIARTAPGAVEEALDSLRGLDLAPALASLDVPILAAYGHRDALIDSAQADAFRSEDAHSRGLVMPGSGHFPMLDEMSRFNRLLRDFLSAGEDLTELELKTEWRRRTR